jgi:HD-GYP domain-containing protein (c-di-GMP phosphodiesterase class II)
MPSVALSQVKLGDRIALHVITTQGGTLLHKGRVVTPRELEILQAFLIASVEIEPREGEEVESVTTKPETTAKEPMKQTSFNHEYEAMFVMLKKVYSTNTSGIGLPILELRNQLEALLKHIKEYNILTFKPVVAVNEDYLFHNSVLSAMTSYLLAQWNLFPQKDWIPIALAGLFHDIGNIKVDKEILHKPSKLTKEESDEVKRHTVYGYNLLKNVAALNEGIKLTVLQHHERYDGSGYPLGINADKIHPYAKIVAIADIFHAMTLKRLYQSEASPYVVLEQLQMESFGKLEPGYVRVFIEKATQFQRGMVVRLNDKRIGEIVFSDRDHPTRPWVNVSGMIINLTTERALHIESVVQS